MNKEKSPAPEQSKELNIKQNEEENNEQNLPHNILEDMDLFNTWYKG